jgi:hypothetical protein
MQLKPRTAAHVAFAATVTLCGIGVHLVAEFAGLGWRADAELIFSAHHIPLGLLAFASLIALGSVGVTVVRRPVGADAIGEIVRALPDGGCGWRFLSLAFAAELFVFGVTEAGEGVPIQAGDLGFGLVAALCASALGALLVWRFQCRILQAIGDLVVLFIAIAGVPTTVQSGRRIEAHTRVWRCRALVFAGSRRPPPCAPAITPSRTRNRSQEPPHVFFVFARARAHVLPLG